MSTQKNSHPQTVTVILNYDGQAASRFQVVTCGAADTAPRPVHTCATQGDVTSWLICNGYQWVENSEPQQWAKS